ncbi:hypothetical protein TUM17575_51670 [Klebsiella pneumoniae]|uniref:hypothetical protein n=1 Tax=Klebsiella pneumoniae TaxID=573 RepID=UPI001E3D1EBA|nr:hypothetical protein [Klebsiella pneumoniae]GJL32578.1 hypothetical protein TUM17575_51670 [Klebsiella pneumoniae]
MKKIGILLKVFSSEQYKEDFLNGNLYMNTINYFRKYEEEAKGNIGDKYEALTGWMHPHEFRFEIEINGVKHTINPDDIVGPITTREGANKQVISSQADSLIKISRIWADFFPANTSNQPI